MLNIRVWVIFSGIAIFPSIVPSFAGVLLTKSNQAEIGTLVESETAVSLQSQNGAVDYKRDTLIWYSVEREVDSFFKAGQKALSEGNLQVARILFEKSVDKETTTQIQAQSELETLKKELEKTGVSSSNPTPPTSGDGSGFIEKEGVPIIGSGSSSTKEGEKGGAEVKVTQDEGQDAGSKISQPREIIRPAVSWTDKEKTMNIAAVCLLIMILFITLWRVTMKESQN